MSTIQEAKYNQLKAYFENLSIQNLKVLHVPGREMHFCRMELHEYLNAIPEKLNFPAVVMESWDFRMNDNRADQISKLRNCALLILQRVTDPNDFDAIDQAYETTEEIVDDFVSRMVDDRNLRNSPVIRDIDFNSIEGIRINPQPLHFGIRITFSLTSLVDQSVNKDAWLDLKPMEGNPND